MPASQAAAEVTAAAGKTDEPAQPDQLRDGWPWLVMETASRLYLVGLMTLAVCALLPAVFGWQGHVIQSGSMEPHVGVGDVVVSTEIPDGEEIGAGQVVFFVVTAEASPTHRETVRMHRIVRINDDDTYITQGDANEIPDSTPVTREQVTGRARLLVPWVGLPTHWIATGSPGPFGLWMILTLGAVLVVAFSTTRTSTRPPDVKSTRGPVAQPTPLTNATPSDAPAS